MKKHLPFSMTTLEDIIKFNYIYIDKTKYAYDLFKENGGYKYVFLSRPRRFGKSLFVDTLKQIFLGKKELFKDCFIYQTDYNWQEYPIIHIDFSTVGKRSVQDLEESLINIVDSYAKKYNIVLVNAHSLENKFNSLIRELSKINRVVILIDEYDKPILDNIKDIQKAEQLRDLLKVFYEVIKGNDSYIRAVFMTGITRFSKMSIFSGLNNLYDISNSDKFAQIAGYTEEDITTQFEDYIVEACKNLEMPKPNFIPEIKKWYNGYRFSEQDLKVYNPFSIIKFFNEFKFSNYWFRTGTPSFLVHILKNQYPSLQNVKQIGYSMDSLGNFELKSVPLVQVLYQAGYLTITDYESKTRTFKLDYPNFEVEESFDKLIGEALLNTDSAGIDLLAYKVYSMLANRELDEFQELLQKFLSRIPSELLIDKEAYYNTIFHCVLNLASNKVYSQPSHFKRRPDTIVIIENNAYIFELKLNKTAKEALDQIKSKRYYEPYIDESNNIFLVGVNINTEDLGAIQFLYEQIK